MPDGQIKQGDIIVKEELESPKILSNNLKLVLADIENITNAAIKMNASLKGVSGFKELSTIQNEAKTATKSLSEAQKDAINIQNRLQKSIGQLHNSDNQLLNTKQRLTQSIKTQTKENIAQEGSIKKLRATIVKLTNQYESLNLKTTQGQQKAKGLTKEILSQENALKKYEAAIGRNQRNVGNYGGALGKLGKQVMSLAASYISMYAAINLIKNVFSITKDLDRLSFSFKTIITDSIELGQTQAYLADLSVRYGQDIIRVADSYVKLRATLKTTNITFLQSQNIYESIVKAASVLGLSSERLELALLAIEQMASKGTVSMEELRRQLGDNIPGAVGIMADALGVAIPELYKMIKANEVLAEDALPAFARQLEKVYGIENINKINTLNAASNNVKNTWTLNWQTGNPGKFFKFMLNGFAGLLKYANPLISLQEKYNETIARATRDVQDLNDVIVLSDKQLYISNNSKIKQKEKELALMNDLSNDYSKYSASILKDEIAALKAENDKLNPEERIINKQRYNELLSKEIIKVREQIDQAKESGKISAVELTYLETKLDLLNQLSVVEDDNNEESIGYLDQLQKEVLDLQNSISKEVMVAGYEPEYWKQIAEWQDKIAKKQEIINRINGKTKSIKKEEDEIVVGLINNLEKEISEKEKLIKQAKSKDEINKLTDELKLRKDLLEILKITEEWKLLQTKGIPDNRPENLPTAFGESDADYEKKVRLFQLAGKYGLIKNDEFATSINELNELLENDKITKSRYFASVANLWMDNNEEIIDAVYQFADEVINAWAKINEEMIKSAQDRVKTQDDIINELKNQLKEETKNKEEGKNNNVAILNGQIAEEEVIRKKALKDLEKAQKQRAVIELASQASSIATAIAKAIEGYSEIPIVGVVLGLAAAAAIIGGFIAMKQQIKGATKYGEGEVDIQGDARPHSQGGKQIEIERHESVIAAKPTIQSKGILKMINEGKLTDKDLGLSGNINLSDRLKASFIGNVPIIHVDKTNTSLIEKELSELRKSQDRLLDYFEKRQLNEIIDPTTGKFYRRKGFKVQEFDSIKSAYKSHGN